MKDQNSRFYPCVALAGTCGGIAAFIQYKYVCQTCGETWDRDGDPVMQS